MTDEEKQIKKLNDATDKLEQIKKEYEEKQKIIISLENQLNNWKNNKQNLPKNEWLDQKNDIIMQIQKLTNESNDLKGSADVKKKEIMLIIKSLFKK